MVSLHSLAMLHVVLTAVGALPAVVPGRDDRHALIPHMGGSSAASTSEGVTTQSKGVTTQSKDVSAQSTSTSAHSAQSAQPSTSNLLFHFTGYKWCVGIWRRVWQGGWFTINAKYRYFCNGRSFQHQPGSRCEGERPPHNRISDVLITSLEELGVNGLGGGELVHNQTFHGWQPTPHEAFTVSDSCRQYPNPTRYKNWTCQEQPSEDNYDLTVRSPT